MVPSRENYLGLSVLVRSRGILGVEFRAVVEVDSCGQMLHVCDAALAAVVRCMHSTDDGRVLGEHVLLTGLLLLRLG